MKLLLALLLACSAFGQQTPSISQKQVDKLVAKWSRILKLTDWDIHASLVAWEDLPEGAAGASKAFAPAKRVVLLICRPEDYGKLAKADGSPEKKGREISADIEDTVVHELVHLRLRDLMNASDRELGLVEETTVNRFTSALLTKR